MGEGVEDSSSIYAAEGSVAHDLGAKLLNEEITPDELENMEGDTVMYDDYEIEITSEMIDAVRMYVDFIVRDLLKDELGVDLKNAKQREQFVYVEKHVRYSDDMWGTSDCSICIPFEKLIVIDKKYGAGIAVDVEENKQMLCYAIATIKELEKGGSLGICEIELVIVQPRASHRDGPIRRWTISYNDLMQFGKELNEHIFAAKQKAAKLVPGSWCRFCPGKHKCPSLFDEQKAIARDAFADSDKPVEEIVKGFSDKKLAQILNKRDMVVSFMKAIDEHCVEKLKAGGSIPGYKLVEGRSNRQWEDEDTIESEFEGMVDVFNHKLKSPAQMEKALKETKNFKMKEAKELVADYTIKPEGKLSLAHESSTKEAVIYDPRKVFAD